MTLSTELPELRPFLRDATSGDYDAIFRINAESRPGVSALTPDYLEALIDECELFRLVEIGDHLAGYLCALGRRASYDGEEFRWFQDRIAGNFLYIDQVAIERGSRRRALGGILYDDLEAYATATGIGTLACEVDHDPLNIASRAFHEKRGFREIGRLPTRGVVVSLLVKIVGT